MQQSVKKRFLAWMIAFLMVFTYMPSAAYAADNVNAEPGTETTALEASEPALAEEPEQEVTYEELSVLDGKFTIHNSAKKATIADGIVKITAPGTAVGKPSPNVITIYNETSSHATISFDYSASNYKAFNLNSSNGTHSEVIEAGSYMTLSITGKDDGSDAVLTMSNFEFATVADVSQVVFSFDSTLGSVTAAGAAIASGDSKSIAYSDGIEVVAEAADGAEFLAWINKETGKVYSREASTKLKPTADAMVEAVFINGSSKAYYLAGGTYLVDDFASAMEKASKTASKVVALMNDTTLTAGTYTVPAGVTLLVPFDDANTVYTTAPKATHDAYVKPTAYRTLTLADGAKLVINGAMSVSAMHYAAAGSQRGAGAPTGNVSFVDMKAGSSITVNDGAALYAYGFVTGAGTVTAKDGATVYENFQLEDFRGGNVTSNMATTYKDYGVLPVSQYYVQNIEVPMTLEAGATEYTYTSVYVSDGIYGAAVAFISEENAMFNLTEGYVVKQYDGTKDRLTVEANGTVKLSPITVSLDKQSINSGFFNLPINGNITVNIKSGEVVIDQDIALLPGSEIIVAEGAVCTLSNGSNVYVYDSEHWGKYCSSGNKTFLPVLYAPSRTHTRTDADLTDATVLVNGTLDASDGFIHTTTNEDYEIGFGNIYSTKSGVIKAVAVYEDFTHQFIHNSGDGIFDEIELLPANLKNENGSYIMLTDDGEVSTYTYKDGFWTCEHNVADNGEVVNKAATCVEDGYKTVTCEMDHVYEVVLPATGKHDMVYTDEDPATCTEPGTASGGYCKNCDYTEGAGDIEPLGHEYGWTTTKPATCTEKGSKEGVCTRCGDKTTAEIDAKGHTRKTVTQKATCEGAGISGKVICSVCNVVLEAGTVTEPLGHKWDDGYVSIKPTVESEGEKCYTCNVCSKTKREVLPKETERKVEDYDTFIELFTILEELAYEYTFTDKGIGKDPAMLVIKYMRTGVDRYNSGSWQMMAGYEDAGFAKYVSDWEEQINAKAASEEDKIYVTALKNLENMYLPNGDYVDLGHMFGTMDISYTNIDSVNHADVAGWAGDTTDLLTTADYYGCTGELEDLVKKITNEYFLKDLDKDDKFSSTDMLGDMDGFYFIEEIKDTTYEKGILSKMMKEYFDEDLTENQRAKYFFDNRLQCGTTRDAVREAVYNAYLNNFMIETLEGTREFKSDEETLSLLRKACCYAVADYLCRLAGDFVEVTENTYYTVENVSYSTLAPGITQEIKQARTADNKNFVYYLATADITRDDVNVYANYAERPIPTNADGSYAWAEESVLNQANDLQDKYGNPESEDYIENYQVVAGINADGFAMLSTGEPAGLHIMDGKVYKGCDGDGFFGILKDGTAVIGTKDEYNNIYKGQVAEGVGGFGSTLIKDGELCISGSSDYYTNRNARTAVGVTKTGKVVFMVLDGNQQASIGGSMAEIAQIMLEAGCIDAINLDGSGSSTYVAKLEGADELKTVNVPSDGTDRKVGNSLMMVSTAPSSTAFHHAVLSSETNQMTIGSSMQVKAQGVSATGSSADLPEDIEWTVSNGRATIDENGVVTAVRTGSVEVQLKQGEKVIGSKSIAVVVPDRITFTKQSVNVVYGSSVTLPVKAYYQGAPVTVNPSDFTYTIGDDGAGIMDGFDFVAAKNTTLTNTKVTLTVKNTAISNSIVVRLYNQGDVTFDFDLATGGEHTFAWQRTVSNAELGQDKVYHVIDEGKDMTTSYTFAIDMSQIPIPETLEDLVEMLPGDYDEDERSAWLFLCDLAERMSDLTEVKAVITFDENVDVDYDNVKVVNDYFKLSSKEFNEETNTLTLTLNWKRQSGAININEANPICIVNGVEMTPKDDAPWNSNNSLNFVNSGEISYEAYLKANSLYTFACDPANQARYNLTPYENDYVMADGDKDKGASFGATYVTFSDSYTLMNKLRNGWVSENGGQAYYVNDEKLTGVQKILESPTESYYYDFGENGIVASKDAKYTGFVENDDHSYSYSRDGILVGGWVKLGEDYYYFAEDTKKNLEGKHKIEVTALSRYMIKWDTGGNTDELLEVTNTVEFDFDSKGKASRTFHTNEEGITYYYLGNEFVCHKWMEIDGEQYLFGYKGDMCKGICSYRALVDTPKIYYMFDDETGAFIKKCEGFIEYGGYMYYYPTEADIKNGVYTEDEMFKGRLTGLQQLEGKYYYFAVNGRMMFGKKNISAYNTDGCQTLNFSKDAGGYAVDANGEIITSLEHSYSEEKYKTPTKSVDGGWYTECIKCGEVNWTKTQTYVQYLQEGVAATKLTAKVSADKAAETIKVTWTRAGEFTMTKYNVYRSTTGKSGSFSYIGSSTSGTYVDKTAKINKKYYYMVRGVRVYDGKSYNSNWSNKPYTTISISKAYVQASAMSAKGSYLGGGVKLTWSKPRVKVAGYEVWRSKTGKAGSYTRLKLTTKLTYSNTKLKAGKKYWYKVRAYKYIGGVKVYTKFSPVVSKVVLNSTNAKLANSIENVDGIINVKATKLSSGIKVTWSKKTAVKCTQYDVYRASSKSGTYTKIATTKNRYYTDKSKALKKGKTYYYKIVGKRTFGKVTVKTKASAIVSVKR